MAKIMDPICLYSLFWEIGPSFWALLEVQVVLPCMVDLGSSLTIRLGRSVYARGSRKKHEGVMKSSCSDAELTAARIMNSWIVQHSMMLNLQTTHNLGFEHFEP